MASAAFSVFDRGQAAPSDALGKSRDGPVVSQATAPARSAAFHVRRAEDADLAKVIALDMEVTGVAKDAYWADLHERYATRRPGERFFFVAESADKRQILGFVIGEIRAWEFGSEPCGWVFGVSVDPEVREHGVGERLLETISAAFRDAGVGKMRTLISHGNHLLMSFFRSQGMMAGPYLQLERDLP